MNPRIKALNYLISVTVFCAIFGAIFSIDPTKEYGWFGGMFHGAWVIGNWILSLFMDDHLVKAPLHTTAYNVFWWIWCVFVSISAFFNLIVFLFGGSKKK